MRTAVLIRSTDGQHCLEDPGYGGTAPVPRIGEKVNGYDDMRGLWEVVDVVHNWVRDSATGRHACMQINVWVKPGGSK